jgi:hypothetical protein
MAKAEVYRTRGVNTVADTLQEDQLRANTMRRGDLEPGVDHAEFSGYTWPNGIFS